jgi:prophage tail gpP-like protein
MAIDDTVWLSINGQKFGGWTAVRVTRGIELMPSSFQISLTERYPGMPLDMPIKPGDPCMVQIGTSIAITGTVDRLMPSIDPRGHNITILGRGRCRNLVDCTAFADNRQFLNHSVLDIATAVCKPFQIVVTERDPGTPAVPNETLTADGQVIPQYNVDLTTTPWQIIEQISRYASLLAYEDVNGDLVLAQVGTAQAASGFQQGVNVQSASSMAAVDQRYSTIWAVALAIDSTLQLTPGAPASSGTTGANVIARESDPGITEYRPLVIVSEQGFGAQDITARRAKWEVARRYGRSQAVTLVVDSWRDSAGNLWSPNTLAPLDIPALHLGGMNWLITEVAFIVDLARGKVAEVTMMPKEAFMPQPPSAIFDGQLNDAMRAAAPGSMTAPASSASTSGLLGHV